MCYTRCQKCRGYHHHLICGVKMDSSKSELVKCESIKAAQELAVDNSNRETSNSLATDFAGVSLSNISVNKLGDMYYTTNCSGESYRSKWCLS